MSNEDTTQEQTPSPDSTENNAIKAVRDANKALQRDLKAAREEAEAAYERARRDIVLEQTLEALGQPEAIKQLLDLDALNEVTRESVSEAIQSLGFRVEEAPTETPATPTQAPAPAPADADTLAAVASLGSQVANAATGGVRDNLSDKINSAETPEDLAEIMREAGLGQ